MSDGRETRLNLTRAILRNEKFLTMNNAEQRAVLDSLLARGLAKQDLKMLLAEKHNEENDHFRILDKPILTKILLSLNPENVISTCTTDKRYANVCSDPSTFQRLLATHYPEAFFTDDHRQQYLALIRGVETHYRMYLKPDSTYDNIQYEKPVQIGKSQAPENTPGWSIAGMSEETLLKIFQNGKFVSWLQSHLGPEAYNKATLDWMKYFDFLRTYRGENPIQEREKMAQTLNPMMREFITWDRRISMKLGTAPIVPDYVLQDGKAKEYRQDPDEDIIFFIKGNSLPSGTEAWALVWQSHTALMDDHVEIYKTREAMALGFVEYNYDHLVDELVQSGFQDYIYNTYGDNGWAELAGLVEGREIGGDAMTNEEIMRLNVFQNFLESYEVPVRPFTREGLYSYAITHDEFRLLPGSERDNWIFRLIVF